MPDSSPPDPPPPPGRLAAALRFAPLVLVAAAAAAFVLRITVRDGIGALAPFFYASPAVVTTFVAAAGAGLAWRYGQRFTGTAGALLTVAAAILHVSTSFVETTTRDGPAPEDPIRAVLWNARHGRHGWDEVTAYLGRFDVDVIFIVEGGDAGSGRDDLWKQAFPEHEFGRFRGGFVCLVRGDLQWLEYVPLHGRGRAARLRLDVRGTPLSVVMVDVAPKLFDGRRPSFERLGELLVHPEDPPHLVLGDFNTPRDSVLFDPWREGRAHAFEASGHGLDATWPVPLPVLALDHVWGDRRIRFLSCGHHWTLASDHRPVRFDFDVR